jgi:hypothetical protein
VGERGEQGYAKLYMICAARACGCEVLRDAASLRSMLLRRGLELGLGLEPRRFSSAILYGSFTILPIWQVSDKKYGYGELTEAQKAAACASPLTP